MKLSQTLLTVAHLATIATAWQPTGPWATTFNFTRLEGDAALAYLFDYDPSVPHDMDYSGRTSFSSSEPPPPRSDRYDGNYITRLCSPLSASGENLIGVNVSELTQCHELSDEECEEKLNTPEFNLQMARILFSGSPYPCERLHWVEQECGINVGDIDGRLGGDVVHNGTFAEQNKCLCDGDYFALQRACDDCYSLHHGNETLMEKNEEYLGMMSSSMCSEAPTATKVMWDYQSSAWESVFPGHSWKEQFNTTIVSDGAQNKTDVGLYVTEGVDWVPATIREPAFTRTVDGKEVVMTPGVLKANAKKATPANAVEATATQTGSGSGNAGAATASAVEGGARSLMVPGGLVFAVVGALLML